MLNDALPIHALLSDHAQHPDHRVPPEVQLLRLYQSKVFPVFRGEAQRVEPQVPRVVLLLEVSNASDGADGPPRVEDGLALDERHERERSYPEEGVGGGDLLEVVDRRADVKRSHEQRMEYLWCAQRGRGGAAGGEYGGGQEEGEGGGQT